MDSLPQGNESTIAKFSERLTIAGDHQYQMVFTKSVEQPFIEWEEFPSPDQGHGTPDTRTCLATCTSGFQPRDDGTRSRASSPAEGRTSRTFLESSSVGGSTQPVRLEAGLMPRHARGWKPLVQPRWSAPEYDAKHMRLSTIAWTARAARAAHAGVRPTRRNEPRQPPQKPGHRHGTPRDRPPCHRV